MRGRVGREKVKASHLNRKLQSIKSIATNGLRGGGVGGQITKKMDGASADGILSPIRNTSARAIKGTHIPPSERKSRLRTNYRKRFKWRSKKRLNPKD